MISKGLVSLNEKPYKFVFYRNFQSFRGGHLKVWHYYTYVKSTCSMPPLITFSPDSLWDESNPWLLENIAKTWEPHKSNVIFMAGFDWIALDKCQEYKPSQNIPIINLIQGFAHVNPDDWRYSFLSRKAIRICVSKEIEQALLKTGVVNGPIFTIPNGLDVDVVRERSVRKIKLLIMGIKQKKLAKELEKALFSLGIEALLILDSVNREEFLELLKSSDIVLTLPLEKEGFYLPALEAMASGCLVICPDCIGNRGFCIDRETCFVPSYTLNSLVDAVKTACNMDAALKNKMLAMSTAKAANHTLDKEREAFLKILNNIDELWKC